MAALTCCVICTKAFVQQLRSPAGHTNSHSGDSPTPCRHPGNGRPLDMDATPAHARRRNLALRRKIGASGSAEVSSEWDRDETCALPPKCSEGWEFPG